MFYHSYLSRSVDKSYEKKVLQNADLISCVGEGLSALFLNKYQLDPAKMKVLANGFDEENFGVAFNDVDLCLRMRERGLLIVYTPYAVMIHHESATRGYDMNQREVKALQKKWGHVQKRDPYYNPNLTRKTEDFSLNIHE